MQNSTALFINQEDNSKRERSRLTQSSQTRDALRTYNSIELRKCDDQPLMLVKMRDDVEFLGKDTRWTPRRSEQSVEKQVVMSSISLPESFWGTDFGLRNSLEILKKIPEIAPGVLKIFLFRSLLRIP